VLEKVRRIPYNEELLRTRRILAIDLSDGVRVNVDQTTRMKQRALNLDQFPKIMSYDERIANWKEIPKKRIVRSLSEQSEIFVLASSTGNTAGLIEGDFDVLIHWMGN
jgi:hypothetical protein